MRLWEGAPFVGACMLLSACGGGGGGGTASAGSAPAPRNSTITNLVASQLFASDAATSTVTLDTSSGTGVAGTVDANTLTISYDAASKSYTVTAPQGSQTFAAADLQASSDADQAIYQKSNGSFTDHLTIVKTPYTNDKANQYVQLAYWQRNSRDGAIQNTDFSAFTFGLDTPAAAVPRIGTAGFRTDVFAFGSATGIEPFVLQGQGSFNVDFAKGLFTTSASLDHYNLVSGGSYTGGGLEIEGSGSLSANGTFSGLVAVSSYNTESSGPLSGRFYGPNADELGAAFTTTSSRGDGATVVGALTGQRDGAAPPVNFTLTDITTEQLFYGSTAILQVYRSDPMTAYAYGSSSGNQLTFRPDGSFTYTSPYSNLPQASFTSANAVPAISGNFKAYESGTGDNKVHVELFKPGTTNAELALTYTSFGIATSSTVNNDRTESGAVFFAYGLDTPSGLLSRRTGTASYAGVVYGAAAENGSGTAYEVRGTSRMSVDFGAQSLTGDMALIARNSQSTTDLGSLTFADHLASGNLVSTSLNRGASSVGTIASRFKGPDGGEMAASFTAMLPGAAGNLALVGVTVAKRQ